MNDVYNDEDSTVSIPQEVWGAIETRKLSPKTSKPTTDINEFDDEYFLVHIKGAWDNWAILEYMYADTPCNIEWALDDYSISRTSTYEYSLQDMLKFPVLFDIWPLYQDTYSLKGEL